MGCDHVASGAFQGLFDLDAAGIIPIRNVRGWRELEKCSRGCRGMEPLRRFPGKNEAEAANAWSLCCGNCGKDTESGSLPPNRAFGRLSGAAEALAEVVDGHIDRLLGDAEALCNFAVLEAVDEPAEDELVAFARKLAEEGLLMLFQ